MSRMLVLDISGNSNTIKCQASLSCPVLSHSVRPQTHRCPLGGTKCKRGNILKITLDEEMNEEFDYSKYDYRNKETDNSRNRYSQKTIPTSYGNMELNFPCDHKSEFEPQEIKKYSNTVTQDMEEKIIAIYAKDMKTADIKNHMRVLSISIFLTAQSAGSRIKSCLW